MVDMAVAQVGKRVEHSTHLGGKDHTGPVSGMRTACFGVQDGLAGTLNVVNAAAAVLDGEGSSAVLVLEAPLVVTGQEVTNIDPHMSWEVVEVVGEARDKPRDRMGL